jgi:glycosyltransferase involved in cell wall biosynthesis
VTVLPSVYDDVFGGHWDRPELLGGVLQESLATGTPVICTAVGGMPEIVHDGENGFVVPPNDPAAIRAAIARLDTDPALRRRLGEAGRAGVRSWDETARAMLELYRA